MTQKVNLSVLEGYFSENEHNDPITIKGSEKVENPSKTANSLIRILKANPKNKGFLPYYKTLFSIYLELTKK